MHRHLKKHSALGAAPFRMWHQEFVCHPTFIEFVRQMWEVLYLMRKHSAHDHSALKAAPFRMWHQGFVCFPTFVELVRQLWGVLERYLCRTETLVCAKVFLHPYLMYYCYIYACPVNPSVINPSVICTVNWPPTFHEHAQQMWDSFRTTVATPI